MMLIQLIAMIILVIGLILAFVLLINEKKNVAAIMLILTICFTISIFGWMYYEQENYQNDIYYEVEILTDMEDNYYLYVPYLDNSKLRSELIKSGGINLEFITVNKTPIISSNNAMKITGLGNTTINANINEHTWPEMSLLARDDISYGNFWVWCNKTNANQSIKISISASISYWNGEINWNTEESETISLENGWNEITLLIDQWVA